MSDERRVMLHLRELINQLPAEFQRKAIDQARTLYAARRFDDMAQLIIRLEGALARLKSTDVAKKPPPIALPDQFRDAVFQEIAGFLTIGPPPDWARLRVHRDLADRVLEWLPTSKVKQTYETGRQAYEAQVAQSPAKAAATLQDARRSLGLYLVEVLEQWRQGNTVDCPFAPFDPAQGDGLAQLGQFLVNAPSLLPAVHAILDAHQRDQGAEGADDNAKTSFKAVLEENRVAVSGTARGWLYAIVLDKMKEPWVVPDNLHYRDPELQQACLVALHETAEQFASAIRKAESAGGAAWSKGLPALTHKPVLRAYGYFYTLTTRLNMLPGTPYFSIIEHARAQLAEGSAKLIDPLIEQAMAVVPVRRLETDPTRREPDLRSLEKDEINRASLATDILSRMPFLVRDTPHRSFVSDGLQRLRGDVVARVEAAVDFGRKAGSKTMINFAMAQGKGGCVVLERLGYVDDLANLRKLVSTAMTPSRRD